MKEKVNAVEFRVNVTLFCNYYLILPIIDTGARKMYQAWTRLAEHTQTFLRVAPS